MQSILDTIVLDSGTNLGAAYPYSIDLLPLNGVMHPAQTLRDLQGRFTQTIKIVDGVLKAPFSLTQQLRQLIENIRFHVINGLYLIDLEYRRGAASRKPYIGVDGLQATIDNHVQAIDRTRPVWRAWLLDARKNAVSTDRLPKASPVNMSSLLPGAMSGCSSCGFGADPIAPATSSPVMPYLIAGGIVLLLTFVVK